MGPAKRGSWDREDESQVSPAAAVTRGTKVEGSPWGEDLGEAGLGARPWSRHFVPVVMRLNLLKGG